MNLSRLTLATFNLFNLNEPGRPIYTGQGWSQEQYDRKIAWTASELSLLAADVFGFQELWHADSLNRALDASGLAEQYDVLVPAAANGSRIVCAAIVRKGLLSGDAEWISAFPEGLVLRSKVLVARNWARRKRVSNFFWSRRAISSATSMATRVRHQRSQVLDFANQRDQIATTAVPVVRSRWWASGS